MIHHNLAGFSGPKPGDFIRPPPNHQEERSGSPGTERPCRRLRHRGHVAERELRTEFASQRQAAAQVATGKRQQSERRRRRVVVALDRAGAVVGEDQKIRRWNYGSSA
jgi:hypothetical protein